MEIKKGTRLKNRYEIVSLIGSGGFGKTYKAIDNLVNRYVAIKVSESDLSHEAKILKALDNVPYISHMYDYFVESKNHFLVMRLITGKSLSAYQKENGGTISGAMLKQILPSALITLNQMHERGIIHRDISPGNFILTEDRILYLIDFGTATALKHNTLFNNTIFKHKGLDTPESSDMSSQGPWTDVYSLCATIVYLLTGNGILDANTRLNYDSVPGLLTNLSLNNRMQNALIKGLHINPAKRYQTIHDFGKDFFGKETVIPSNIEDYSVLYHARTDIGSRPINQDNFMVDALFSYAGEDCEIKGYIDCAKEDLHVVALADGVASSNHGELASKAAIQAVSHFIDSYKYSEALPQNLLEELLNQLNEKIIFLGSKIGKTASTISIFLWKNDDFYAVNIGDSPIYKLSHNKLTCLSYSHTVANEKIARGEMVNVNDLHSITHYLGMPNIAGSELAYIKTGKIEKGDIILICSDGVSSTTTESDKIKFMKRDSDKAIKSIFKCTHRHPHMDNCTAIILKF